MIAVNFERKNSHFDASLPDNATDDQIQSLSFRCLNKTVPTDAISPTLHRTHFKIEVMSLCKGVSKILTLCRIHKIILKKYHVKAFEQNFLMMCIKGGSTFGRSQSKRGFSPKNCLKNSFFGGHETGSTDFGGGWDPQF